MKTGNSSRQSFTHGNRTSVKLHTIGYTWVIMEIETLFWHNNVHIINIPQREALYLSGFDGFTEIESFCHYYFVCATDNRYVQNNTILNMYL